MCCSNQSFNIYASIDDVDLVIGNKEKLNENTWSSLPELSPIQVTDIFKNNYINKNIVDKFEGKSRAYIEIQHGCDHRCTFCIIPFGRGNNRSIPTGVVIERIKKIVNNGYKEVVLTGVDITDYGKDLPGAPNLFQLVKRILNLVPELEHLRLSSIDCAEISSDFWPLLKEKRLMPHFHLSLQAGNNLILKRMKRRHTKEQAINFCKKVREKRKDAVFGADIIAGFPTESDQMFNDSVELVKKCNLIHLHVFPFSSRELTPAARMPQVSKDTIKKRAKTLRNLGNNNLNKYLNNQIGFKVKVLIEQIKNNHSLGKSQHFTKVKIAEKLNIGSIVDCIITNVDKDISTASLIL